ncbi:HTH_Tnp_Tc3_2 domain-containing protein [Trichonephila clavipes]|nr:HTH_Tnp_Tc3_2 domain-containing protein [Trichonephila clavipes]
MQLRFLDYIYSAGVPGSYRRPWQALEAVSCVCGTPSLESISNRRICVQKTCSRSTMSHNIRSRKFNRSYGPKEKKDFCDVTQLVADQSVASGRRIFASTVRMCLLNSGLYARRPVVCVSVNRRKRRTRLSWATEHVYRTR